MVNVPSSSSSLSAEFPPAFVISLDFELHWGVSERVNHSDHPYMANLHGARDAVGRLLELFEHRGIRATWATVGKLFAHGRDDLEFFKPEVRPSYERESVDTYRIQVGASEVEDPLHFAASLVERIRQAPQQELACHTFAHYFCNEPGQDVAAFQADLQAAQTIAVRDGAKLRSLVFPRNQVLPDYLPALEAADLDVYRGNPPAGLFTPSIQNSVLNKGLRALRLADSYVNLTGHHTVPWASVNEGTLANVCASQLLRPYSRKLRFLEPLRRRRVKAGLRTAAKRGEIFHLWWHPHNFGINQDENLAALEDILDEFERLRDEFGMQSMTMAEVADRVSTL